MICACGSLLPHPPLDAPPNRRAAAMNNSISVIGSLQITEFLTVVILSLDESVPSRRHHHDYNHSPQGAHHRHNHRYV